MSPNPSRLFPEYTRSRVFVRYWIHDHALVRVLVPNFYKVDADVFRSNHPGRRRLKRAKSLGVRSVLSLRDPDCIPSRMEQSLCRDLGLDLQFVPMRTVRLPPSDTFRQVLARLRDMPKPMLVHCKSGADRTGLAITLYRHVILGEPLQEARRALHWRFGHLAFGKAGIVHAMIDAYDVDHRRTGVGFEDWLSDTYDPLDFNDR